MQRLTSREREIALLVCTGLSNKQFAQQLTVSPEIAILIEARPAL